MAQPKDKDTHFVRCLKCGKILQCSRYDTMTLLDHIRQNHPDIVITDEEPPKNNQKMDGRKSPNVVDFAPKDEVISIKSERINVGISPANSLPEIKVCANCTSKDEDSSSMRRNKMRPAQSSHRGNLYRTSIEKWCPAKGTIYCPKCGCNKRPLVRTQTERLTESTCCAACILTCWPFCFLPFLFPSQNREYLHCSNCKTFLGLYDRENNCIKPNREYVDVIETVNQEDVR